MSTGKKTRAYENRTRFFRAMFARKIVVVATVIVVLVILSAIFADFLRSKNIHKVPPYL